MQKITEKVLKKGESQAQIESDVKSLDERIEELNKEISGIRVEKQQDMVKDSDSMKKDNLSKTENEVGRQSSTDNDMVNLLNSKAELGKIKVSYDQDIKNKEEANILRYEIKEDRSRGVDTSARKKSQSRSVNCYRPIL